MADTPTPVNAGFPATKNGTAPAAAQPEEFPPASQSLLQSVAHRIAQTVWRPRNAADRAASITRLASVPCDGYALTEAEALPIALRWGDRLDPLLSGDEVLPALREATAKPTKHRGTSRREYERIAARVAAGIVEDMGGYVEMGQWGGEGGGVNGTAPAAPVPAPAPPPQPAATTTAGPLEPDEPFANFYEQEVRTGQQTRIIFVGHPVEHITAELLRRFHGWPKRVGDGLFVPDGERPLWLDKTPKLFAWIGRQFPPRGQNPVRWLERGTDIVSQAQLSANLQIRAEQYDAVESYPHEPQLPRHYYLHRAIGHGDGKALDRLLSKFLPATDTDRWLIKAFYLSLVWGGLLGLRPIWLYITDEEEDTEEGCGAGKSKVAQKGAQLVGGFVACSNNDKMSGIITRLLSKEALGKRVAIIDNLKTMRFSWPELEGLVTSPVVSGHAMYQGEGCRPNMLSWVVTVNGPVLARDMVQRAVVCKVKRPKEYTATWDQEVDALIERDRWAILADIVTALRRPAPKITVRSRWGAWEQEVLARAVPDVAAFEKVQEELARRRVEVNDNEDKLEELYQVIVDQLARRGHFPQEDQVYIPTTELRQMFRTAMGQDISPNLLSRRMNALANRFAKEKVEEKAKENLGTVRKDDRNAYDGGRGWEWTGPKFKEVNLEGRADRVKPEPRPRRIEPQ